MSGFGNFGQQSWGTGEGFGQQSFTFGSNLFSSSSGSGLPNLPLFRSSSSASLGDFSKRPFSIDPRPFPIDLQAPVKNWHFEDLHRTTADLYGKNQRGRDGLIPTLGLRWDSENGLRGQSGLQANGLSASRSYACTKTNFLTGLAALVAGAKAISIISDLMKSSDRRGSILKERRRAGWEEGTHVAVVGAAGTGKSSLVNSLRGIRNGRPGAAPVGTTETTRTVERYLRHGCDDFWIHDVPGAGTVSVQDEGYFGSHLLHLYDCIWVVYSGRLRTIDIALLKACETFEVPACLVRSNSDQMISNIMDDNDMTFAEAKKHHITTTFEDIREAFKEAELPKKMMSSVFLVNKNGMYSFVTGGATHQSDIHEGRLMEKLSSFSL